MGSTLSMNNSQSLICDYPVKTPERNLESLINNEDSGIQHNSSKISKPGKQSSYQMLKSTLINTYDNTTPFKINKKDDIYATHYESYMNDKTKLINKSQSTTINNTLNATTHLNESSNIFQRKPSVYKKDLGKNHSPAYNIKSKNNMSFTNDQNFYQKSKPNYNRHKPNLNMTSDLRYQKNKTGPFVMPKQYSFNRNNMSNNSSKYYENQKSLIGNRKLTNNTSTSNLFDYNHSTLEKFNGLKSKSYMSFSKSHEQLPPMKKDTISGYKSGLDEIVGDFPDIEDAGNQEQSKQNLALTYKNMMINRSRKGLKHLKQSSMDSTWAKQLFKKETDQWVQDSMIKFDKKTRKNVIGTGKVGINMPIINQKLMTIFDNKLSNIKFEDELTKN